MEVDFDNDRPFDSRYIEHSSTFRYVTGLAGDVGGIHNTQCRRVVFLQGKNAGLSPPGWKIRTLDVRLHRPIFRHRSLTKRATGEFMHKHAYRIGC